MRVGDNLFKRTTSTGRDVFETKFRDRDGKYRSKTLKATTLPEATKEARKLLARRDDGERINTAKLTLAAFVDEDYFPTQDGLVAAQRRSERGVDYYRDCWTRSIESALGSRRLSAIEAPHVAELIRSMRAKGYSENTIVGTLVVLSAIFRLARNRGYVSRSPLDGLDPAERPKAHPARDDRRLDEHELAKLVASAPDGYREIVTVLAYTGLRLSEVCGLHWRDVDFVEGDLHVRGQLSQPVKGRTARIVKTKTDASVRIVPLWPAVEQALARQLEAQLRHGRGNADDLVFCNLAGKPYSQVNVRNRGVIKAAENAGLGHVTPQVLRASFCSLAGRRGVDPVEAAQITGHSVVVWARHYATSFGKSQRDEARQRMLDHGFGLTPDSAGADTSIDSIPADMGADMSDPSAESSSAKTTATRENPATDEIE
jgi:integrase